jgi:hypothetical protein
MDDLVRSIMFDGNGLLKKFDKDCDEIHAKMERERPKDRLYKYTTYKGLENILVTKRLRYTDYRFFNDPTEILFGKGIIKNTLLAAEIPADHKDIFLKVINNIFDNFDNQYQIYVGCFSASIKKLALWRYYACDGAGFAIGFNENFQKISYPIKSKPEDAYICKVVYGKENAREIIDEFIEQYTSALNSSINFARHNSQREDEDAFIHFWENLAVNLTSAYIHIFSGAQVEVITLALENNQKTIEEAEQAVISMATKWIDNNV